MATTSVLQLSVEQNGNQLGYHRLWVTQCSLSNPALSVFSRRPIIYCVHRSQPNCLSYEKEDWTQIWTSNTTISKDLQVYNGYSAYRWQGQCCRGYSFTHTTKTSHIDWPFGRWAGRYHAWFYVRHSQRRPARIRLPSHVVGAGEWSRRTSLQDSHHKPALWGCPFF